MQDFIFHVKVLESWQHPQHGLLFPDSFIDLVEVSEIIHPFTRAVIAIAVKEKKLLQARGFDLPVAVNLSARNLLDDTCYQSLMAALAAENLSTAAVELELTESALMHDPIGAGTLLQQFSQAGLNIAIDDFGTGYSSLAHLRRLPVAALKIDRTFVMDMLDNNADQAIVRSTIALAHSLDLKVVAEGVEDDEVLALLKELDCDQAQGYGICRPQPLDQLVDWLDQNHATQSGRTA